MIAENLAELAVEPAGARVGPVQLRGYHSAAPLAPLRSVVTRSGVLARLQEEWAAARALPEHILAPTDSFFSASDGAPSLSSTTWADVERDDTAYMLVDVD